MPEPVIICLHQPALELAEKVASLCDGEVHGLQSRVKTIPKTFEKTKEHLQDPGGALWFCLLYTSPSPRD